MRQNESSAISSRYRRSRSFCHKISAYLIAKHFFVNANRLQQLRIEVYNQQHRKNVRPEENRYYECPRVLVVREKIEATCGEKTL